MKPPTVILAGGRSSRMGGNDKGSLLLDGRPLLAHVVEALVPQVGAILINTNSDNAFYAEFDLPLRPDMVEGFQGPLAGLLTGLRWAQEACPGSTHLLSVPCDTPFLPGELAAALGNALLRTSADIAIARDTDRIHPTIGLWPMRLAPALAAYLERNANRSVHRWLNDFDVCNAMFGAAALRNLNTPDDFAMAEAQSQGYSRRCKSP